MQALLPRDAAWSFLGVYTLRTSLVLRQVFTWDTGIIPRMLHSHLDPIACLLIRIANQLLSMWSQALPLLHWAR